MTKVRTPRQQQGEDLIPLTVMILPDTKDALRTFAEEDQRSLSQVGRMALEAYVEDRYRARDVTVG